MATNHQPPRRSKPDIIQCPNCKEEYSTTYRRCPFCNDGSRGSARSAAAGAAASRSSAPRRSGEEPRERRTDGERRSDGERRRSSQSTESRGRRVARTTRGGGYGKPAYLNQIIFFAVTLSLIIAACVVVGKVIGPLLGRDTDKEVESSVSTSVDEQEDITPDVVITPEVVEPEPVSTVVAIGLSASDVTLGAGESFTLNATLSPADATDTIIWTTDSSAATVSLAGLVTNTNTGSGSVAVTVTATVGDVSASCIVRCKSSSASSSASTTGTGNATVVASSGLNIRSGPSTDDAIIASLENGSAVTVVSTPATGWYEISYYNASGTLQTGYASSSYITVN